MATMTTFLVVLFIRYLQGTMFGPMQGGVQIRRRTPFNAFRNPKSEVRTEFTGVRADGLGVRVRL
jgi:hypothetical protein